MRGNSRFSQSRSHIVFKMYPYNVIIEIYLYDSQLAETLLVDFYASNIAAVRNDTSLSIKHSNKTSIRNQSCIYSRQQSLTVQ